MSSLADLIEHVLETEGDAYLKTPDDELSFLVRNSIDTHASVGAFAAVTVATSMEAEQSLCQVCDGWPQESTASTLSRCSFVGIRRRGEMVSQAETASCESGKP